MTFPYEITLYKLGFHDTMKVLGIGALSAYMSHNNDTIAKRARLSILEMGHLSETFKKYEYISFMEKFGMLDTLKIISSPTATEAWNTYINEFHGNG